MMEQAVVISPENSMNNSETYLEAKRNFVKRRSVISQQRLKLIKS